MISALIGYWIEVPNSAHHFKNQKVKLYTLCKQLLSEQQHYDWGLRALKTILNTAGKMLHQQQAATGVVKDIGQLDIAVRAITINTTSKLTYSDVLLFRSLLKRIFPECEQKTMEDAELEARLTEVAAKKKLALYPDLIRKSGINDIFVM